MSYLDPLVLWRLVCWNVLEVCGVSSWVEVGGPAPPRTSLGSAWPHCLGPTLPTIASGPQDTGLHSALCRYTNTTLQYILWGSVCEPSVNQTPGNVPRCIQRGVFLSIFFNGEIVLKHSLLGSHLMSCVL